MPLAGSSSASQDGHVLASSAIAASRRQRLAFAGPRFAPGRPQACPSPAAALPGRAEAACGRSPCVGRSKPRPFTRTHTLSHAQAGTSRPETPAGARRAATGSRQAGIFAGQRLLGKGEAAGAEERRARLRAGAGRRAARTCAGSQEPGAGVGESPAASRRRQDSRERARGAGDKHLVRGVVAGIRPQSKSFHVFRMKMHVFAKS